jgi:hypothetical protein
MSTYEVEFRLTSFVTYSVEANGMGEAEFIAYQELVKDKYLDNCNVMTESVEQINQGETK